MANKNIKVMNKQDVEAELEKVFTTFAGNLCPKSTEARERVIRNLDRKFAMLFESTNTEYFGVDIDENDTITVSYMVEGQLGLYEY